MFKWFANRKLKYINTDALTKIPPPQSQPDIRKETAWQKIIATIKGMNGNYVCIEKNWYGDIPYKELKCTLQQAGYHLCNSGAYRFCKSDYNAGYTLYIQKEV